MLTESILRKAHAWNTQNDITGVLCQGQGVFLHRRWKGSAAR